MDFIVGIFSRNLATTSNFVEFRDNRNFHVFRGNGGSAGHLTHFQWFTECHVSCAELVKYEFKCGPWVDTWHYSIGGKSKVGGYENKV